MWATEADIPEIEAFLGPRAAQNMFPLNNLYQFGLDSDHGYAPNYWLVRASGRITDILTITNNGMVMPQCPSMDWPAYAEAFLDRDLTGVIGPAVQCRSFINAVGLDQVATNLNHDEPQYELDLANLVIPEGIGDIVPLADADKAEMIRWRYEYEIEALNTPTDEAMQVAEVDYASYVANRSHVTLMDGETALCTTGFNARLPDIVQIGGVYTPPELRQQGYARRAGALHLAQARDQGVSRATLFSANEYASRAYQAIGFTYVGQWTLCLFNGKHRAHV